jgi:hypothetical protein
MINRHKKPKPTKGGPRDMDIKSIIEAVDLFFGPIARIIGYIATIGGAVFAVVCFIKKIIKKTQKKKENRAVAIEVNPKQKPKMKCI